MSRKDRRAAARAAKAQPNGNVREVTPATDDDAPALPASPLAEAVAEARALTVERDNGQARFNALVNQRQAQVRQILEAADVWDRVDALNQDTERSRQVIEARRQVIAARLGELDAVVRFLRPRQQIAEAAAAKAAEE
tara:strand:+ start:1203 stop:1616 length:414 start_codon:yes stop_codon:yes gene_type:complete